MPPSTLLLASFNGGPTDAQAWTAVAIIALAAIAAGARSRRIIAGALFGGLVGFLVTAVLLSLAGGFLGAEFVLLVFTAGGATLGALAAAVARLIAWALGRSRQRQDATS